MNQKTLDYAKKNIDIIAQENGIKVYTNGQGVYIELASGRNFRLHDDEIIYQAKEYLRSEIDLIDLG